MIQNMEEYRQSLQDGREVYYRGKRVEDVMAHPVLRTQGNLMEYYFQPRYYFESPDLGQKISRFFKVPRNSSDLLERSQITYEITKEAGILLPHIGSDAALALTIATSNLEPRFRENFRKHAEEVMRQNYILAVAQIDVKGNRRLRASQQEDPDLFVHVVEEKPDGIIVRGAKMHTTYTAVAHEIFVLPGMSFREGEEEYAISFVVPTNAKGLRLIVRPEVAVEGALHDWEAVRARKRTAGETLTIFDNVFVPWEHVFLYRNVAAASRLALLFALWHRLSALSYRTALSEHLIGLGKLVAEANGVDRASHIQRDIAELISFTEIQRVCARMAAHECRIDKKTGIAVPNNIYTNVGKLYSNANYLNVIKSLIDIAGGAAITSPSADDYADEWLKTFIDKYMRGAVPGEERFKLMLLLRETIALMGGSESVIHVHAEGSMEASIIELYRSYDFKESKKMVEDLLAEMK